MLKEKLTEAINAKNNDVNSFVWKYPRDNEGHQKEVKLMDVSEEQLNSFYKHAMSMLYSTNSKNPGRYVVRENTQKQMDKCNVELFLREYRKGTLTGGVAGSQFVLSRELQSKINENKEILAEDKLKNIPITAILANVPSDYKNISIALVRDCCMDQLGVFNSSRISYKFITSLGVFISDEEVKSLIEKNERGRYLNRENLVKESLGIEPKYSLKINSRGLSYSELRSMIELKSNPVKKYSSLTTDQLLTLRNKVLFRFEQKINHQISQWEENIRQIKKVAEVKGYTLSN